jgi:hypothetical protein
MNIGERQAYTTEMHRMAGVVAAIHKSSMTDAEKLKATGRGCGFDAGGCEARAGSYEADEERASLRRMRDANAHLPLGIRCSRCCRCCNLLGGIGSGLGFKIR